MEPNFNSSFIPKHTPSGAPLPGAVPPIQAKRGGGFGLGFFLSTLIFFLSIMLAVGVFAYIKITERAIEVNKEEVLAVRAKFQPEATNVLARFDTRLKQARTLLKNHIAPTGLLVALEKATLADVQYLTLTYQGSEGGSPGEHSLVVEGKAKNYQAVALQTDQFSLPGSFRVPFVTKLEREEGAVSFAIQMQIDPELVRFNNVLTRGDYTSVTPATQVVIPATQTPVVPEATSTQLLIQESQTVEDEGAGITQ